MSFIIEFPQDLREEVSLGTDIYVKYPGEDDLIWCERCKCNHRHGAPWPIEEARLVDQMVQQLVNEIDRETYLNTRDS